MRAEEDWNAFIEKEEEEKKRKAEEEKRQAEGTTIKECKNKSNPYHECTPACIKVNRALQPRFDLDLLPLKAAP